jgi:hypothetical protein
MADANDRMWKVDTNLICGQEIYHGCGNTRFAIQCYEEALQDLTFLKGQYAPEKFEHLKKHMISFLGFLYYGEMIDETGHKEGGFFNFEKFFNENPGHPGVVKYNDRMKELREKTRLIEDIMSMASEIPS